MGFNAHPAAQKSVTEAYENYDFHVLYHAIHDFCVVEMSSFYLDIIKDRLYASKADDKKPPQCSNCYV